MSSNYAVSGFHCYNSTLKKTTFTPSSAHSHKPLCIPATSGDLSHDILGPAALSLTDIGDYRFGKVLGQGAYAVVKEAQHRDSGFSVAVKIQDKYKLVDA
jgi:hypothetical protein